MIPFNSLHAQHTLLRKEILSEIEKVYDSNWYILGDALDKFEKEFSNYLNTSHCIGVGNGLDAIKIALKAIDIKEGDEIIIAANAFIAAHLAITDIGATPVLVEPNPSTFNIDPDKIEAKITQKTKAIIAVHLFGLPCEMGKILSIAKKYDLLVIEDNAQAVGAKIGSQQTGSFGAINATSFYPTKNLGALGDGGAITTNATSYADKAKQLRNYGSSKKYYNDIEGYNSRLDELQAAVLSVELKHLDAFTKERISLAASYSEGLASLKNIILPSHEPNYTHAFHLYVIQVENREALIHYLDEKKIQTAIHYPVPFYKQKAYEYLGISDAEYPITNRLAQTSLSLPLYPGLSKKDQDYIIETILNFYK